MVASLVPEQPALPGLRHDQVWGRNGPGRRGLREVWQQLELLIRVEGSNIGVRYTVLYLMINEMMIRIKKDK